jgi:hypothetical protein
MAEFENIPQRRSFVSMRPNIASVKGAFNADRLQKKRVGEESGNLPVRRPYQGMQLKGETNAILSVVGLDNKPIPLTSGMGHQRVTVNEDGSRDTSFGVDDYSDFILQQVQDQRAEKHQIVETFGDAFVFFYGEAPRLVTFSGILLNTIDFNWRSQFWYNYNNFFRGTRLVQLNARSYLAYDTIVIEGYPITATARENSQEPYSVMFDLTMFVTSYYDYSNVGFADSRPQDYQVDDMLIDKFVGLTSDSVNSVDKIKNYVWWNELKLQSNVRWQLSRTMANLHDRIEEGIDALGVQEGYAAFHRAMSTAGGVVDDLAAQAGAAKRSFAMLASRAYPPVATLAAVAEDPGFVAKNILGLGNPLERDPLTTPATTIGRTLNSLGLKTATATPKAGYVGASSTQTFTNKSRSVESQLEAGQTVELELGQAYDAWPYSDPAEDTPQYEEVYGDRDYAEVVAEDAEIGRTLGEAYGDVDNAIPVAKETFEENVDPYEQPEQAAQTEGFKAASDINPEVFSEVYKTGVSSKFTRSAEDILALLNQIQSGTESEPDENTVGIRGVDDADSDIEPVI